MAEPTKSLDPVEAFARLPELVNADDFLVHRGRFLDVDFLVEIGEVPFIVTIERGRVKSCERGPFPLRSWEFAVRGSLDGWRKFLLPVPPPQFHDIFALVKRKEFRLEGNLYKFMANLLYIKDVLAAPRTGAQAGVR